MAKASPGLKFADDIDELPEEVIAEQESVLYIWDSLEPIFNLYKILRNYHSKDYEINSNILIELIKTSSIDMHMGLEYIPYIHSGYTSIIFKQRELDNG